MYVDAKSLERNEAGEPFSTACCLVGALEIHPYPKIVEIICTEDGDFASPSDAFSNHTDLAILPRNAEEPLVTAVDLLSHRA